jgi:hypothetical protein
VLAEGAMFAFLAKLLLVARSRLKSRAGLEAENLVLRQQAIVTLSPYSIRHIAGRCDKTETMKPTTPPRWPWSAGI